MYGQKALLHLLVALVALFSVANAAGGPLKTDSNGALVSTSPPSSTSSAAPPTSTTAPTSTTKPSTTSAAPVTTSSAAPAPNSPTTSAQPVSTSSPGTANAPSSTNVPNAPLSTSANGVVVTVTQAPVPGPTVTVNIQSVVVITGSDGSSSVVAVVQTIYTSDNAVQTAVYTTPAASVTAVAAAQSSSASDPNANTGLTNQQKQIIGGVVGGVGGALLVGALALVAWRVWGKNRHTDDENHDYLVNMNEGKDGPGPSPFQATLDQYHNPAAGKVNTSANF